MDRSDAMPEDAKLAHLWASGDVASYEALVTRFAPVVYHRCRRALGDGDADDAAQAVFLVLARRGAQAAAAPLVAAWLMRVTTNVIRNALRDRARRRRAERAVPVPVPAYAAPEVSMEGWEQHLDACLARLPAVERDAVVLHHLGRQTLAEVARAQGAGLSTVKERLQRGLARLHTALVARGVSLSLAALVAGLEAQACEPVPAVAMAHLQALGQVVAGGAEPSERVLRWSYQGPSPRTWLAMAAGVVLLAGLLALLIRSSAGSAPQPIAVENQPSLDPPPPVAATTMAGIWGRVRIVDGARTCARLGQVPERVLLGEAASGPLAELATLRRATAVWDGQAMAHPKDILPHCAWWMEVAAGSPLLGRIQATIDQRAEPSADRSGIEDHRISVMAAEGRIGGVGRHLPVAWVEARQRDDSAIAASDADLEVDLTIGDRSMGRGALTVLPDGVRLSYQQAFDGDAERVAELDLSRFDLVPEQAFVAVALARHRQVVDNPHDLQILGRHLMFELGTDARSQAIGQALAAIDGAVVAWLQPGSPIPTATLVADLPQAAADRLLSSLGTPRAADGSVTFLAGMVPMSLGWRDGRLICTTHPAGPQHLTQTGGFTRTPEIVRALAQLPTRTPSVCLLLRPAALAAAVGPYVGMIDASWSQRTLAYQQRLIEAQATGWLTVVDDGRQSQVEAAGLLAVIAGGAMAGQAMQQGMLLRSSN